jgi:hypothetical protein
MFAQPVPPLATGKVPVTSLARLISDVPTTPAVALRNPVMFLNVNPLEATSWEVEAVPVTASEVVVALVVVEFVTVRPVIVASVEVSALAIAVVKLPSTAKRLVDVAYVVEALVAKKLVEVAFVATKFVVVAFCVMTPVEDAAANEIDPAVKLPATVRLPERDVSPLADRLVAETDVPDIEPPAIVGLLMVGVVIVVLVS